MVGLKYILKGGLALDLGQYFYFMLAIMVPNSKLSGTEIFSWAYTLELREESLSAMISCSVAKSPYCGWMACQHFKNIKYNLSKI
jgi:hypothetical protein